MSFEHAPVTKGLMLGCALASIVAGVFDVKHYLHLQLVPHLSRYHQYWRLFGHHVAYSNSSDLFLAEIILYNVSVPVERAFGSVKFASFAVMSTLVATIIEFASLLIFHRFGFNYIHSGPTALIFSILYQYSRLIPSVYQFRMFGIPLSNKSYPYLLALQLAILHYPSSVAVAIIGILAGQIYRSDLASLKSYRLPAVVVRLSSRYVLPLIGSTRPPRRSHLAFPDERPNPVRTVRLSTAEDEVVTTAPTAPPETPSTEPTGDGNNRSVVREWVNELTGRADRASAGLRVPSETEIANLTNIFPDLQRDVIVAALQRRYVRVQFSFC
ncbi:hypothetical protein GLOTRDRAFT_113815 [Gloeophyllum trabeum ATCC 11539]|uniref:Derlin n=1 Tax=Gloeophyllum trabeum (strain ATCC 11539 / FP-39264 / Madison 617) TaxID=670483 RepID=S7QIA3_GLOTA|nr:uncharacterized protein GLOTRDRAFT_113815 [Gloeophyllum trabeum ATCC 11539]EPQ58968.1 hypothetical protein GLOTRDRAFT_113815 [Gloeophyllum trabeum ATCC 11539]